MLQLDSLEAVQVQLGLAQSVHALFKMYLLSVGINPADHPVNHEAVGWDRRGGGSGVSCDTGPVLCLCLQTSKIPVVNRTRLLFLK
jgi:hypothetical protein